MSSPSDRPLAGTIKTQVLILGGGLALFWLTEIVDQFLLGNSLNNLGIRPWSIRGLGGIFFAPFLHGNFPHLIANSIPFVVLGWLVMLQEISDFWIVSFLTMLVGGLGVWLFGAPNSVHIGASILIFGYMGFLMLRGYFQRNLASIALSLLALFLYGSAIQGVLPLQAGISWQGHLFGFLGGVLAAKLIATEKKA